MHQTATARPGPGFGLIRPYLRPQRALFVGSVAAAAGQVVVSLVEPWPIALAVDGVLTDGPVPGWAAGWGPVRILVVSGVATLALALLRGVLAAVAHGTAQHGAERVGGALRAAAVRRALGLSLRWHDRTPAGDVVSRLTTDVGRVLDALVAMMTTLIPDLLLFAGILGVLVAVDAPLALIGLAVLPGLALLTAQQRQRVRAAERAARDATGRAVGTVTELLRAVRAVQAFARADLAGVLQGEADAAAVRARLRAVHTESIWAAVPGAVLAVGTGAALLVGGLQVRSGEMTTGELIVVLAYLRDLSAPVRGLVHLAGVRAKAAASLQRVADVLLCEEAVRVTARPVPLPAGPVELQLDRVRFAYTDDRPILTGLTLTVAAGETVCLFGPSGSGKSTVLHLLLRLYDVDGGRVLVGGVDVRDLNPVQLRRHLAYVPQEPWLLEGTLADNISFGAPGASREDVLSAGRMAGVDEFAGRLPQGYDTPLGEGAQQLSGGQRRRVAIARAVVARAPVLLLDEPTTSLDAAAAEHVIAAVRAVGRSRTVLLVSHDARLAAIADRVVRITPARPADDEPGQPGAAPGIVPPRSADPGPVRAADSGTAER